MTDNIFQVKPNFYGLEIDLIAAWKKLTAQRRKPGAEDVAVRFVELFELHGVAVTQIPRLIPEISLADLATPLALLTALNQNVIESTCELFGISREWLDGTSSRLYETNFCYKSPKRFFEKLSGLSKPENRSQVRAVTTKMDLDYRSSSNQRIELIMVETIGWLGDRELMRYQIFSDGWQWSYSECRLQLKAMVRAYGSPVPLFLISNEQMEQLSSGSLVPTALVDGPLCTEPSLEDFCLSMYESRVAKETEELDKVFGYMQEHGLSDNMKIRLP